MATSYIFNNRLVKLPGAYSTIKSGIKNQSATSTYGNILIIDTGSGATFGGGSGSIGALASGKDAVYEFDNIDDFRSFTKGGYWWLLSDPLFRPSKFQQGVSKIYWAKAATTAAAEMTFAPTGGGSAGGSFVVQTKDEGLIGNGVETSSVLTKGYCYTFTAGEIDSAKFILKFWVGQFKGLAADGLAYDGIVQASCKPMLVAKSKEFSNIQEVFDWAATDPTFNNLFKVKTATKTGTGVITSADLSTITGNRLASGGTETYSTTALNAVLDAVKDLDYSFILSDKAGYTQSTDNTQSTENGMILAHLTTEAKYEKVMVVAGGDDSTQFDQTTLSSKSTAAYFNTDKAIVVHGAIKKTSNITGLGYRTFSALYKAAAVLGRICGLQPQVPITFKDIDIDGEVHQLNDKQKTKALDAGILVTYWDTDLNKFTVLQGINSLQNNANLINSDATSYSIQIKRIVAQINKELVINAKKELLSQPYGVNRNTLSPAFLRDWTVNYLKSRVASEQVDNLIVSFPASEVTVTRNQDAYFVNYAFVPNGEITKLFFTGFLID